MEKARFFRKKTARKDVDKPLLLCYNRKMTVTGVRRPL